MYVSAVKAGNCQNAVLISGPVMKEAWEADVEKKA